MVKDSYLYNLSSLSEGLGHFKAVCLVSSYQDQYVPFDSARIEISGKAEDDAK